MNPVLHFRDRIAEISLPLRDEFDQLVANIGTGWAIEHDADGHHAAITSTSATVSGPVRCGRLSISPLLFPDILSASVTTIWYPPGVTTAGGIFIRSSGAVTIYGLSTDGREEGDVCALINGNQSVDAISFRMNATALAGAAGMFRADGALPDTDIAVPCGRWVWGIVTKISPSQSNTKLFWRLHHF